jgi:hypothetical protein
MSHLSHIQLLFTADSAVAADAAPRRDGASASRRNSTGCGSQLCTFRLWRKSCGVGLALAGRQLSCAYTGIFAGLMVGYATLVLAATRRLWRSAAYWTAIAAGAATSLALVIPFFIPFLRVQKESGFGRSVEDTARWSARAHDYLVSPMHAHAWLLDIARRIGPWGEVLFPGSFAIGLGAIGIALAVFFSGRASRTRETAILYGTLAVLAFWASFGPGAGLYRVLYYLPTFSFLRAPSRLGLVVVLCLAVFARSRCSALFARLTPAPPLAARSPSPRDRRRRGVSARWARAPTCRRRTRSSRAARAARWPSSRSTASASPSRCTRSTCSSRRALDADGQRLQRRDSGRLPRRRGVLDGFPSGDAFSVLARRRVRYIASTGTCMRDGRTKSAAARAVLPQPQVLAGDDRMTLYEVVKFP